MANVQRLMSENEDLQVKNVSLEELDSRNRLYIHRLEKELAEKGQLISGQKLMIAQYEHEMTRKTQDLRRLHTMIAESRPESDPFDDNHFTTGFAELATAIQSVVKRHFQTTRSNTRWRDFEHVRETDDRDFFLQAHIATQLAHAFFSRNARLFDLDPKSEADLADFEDLLHQSQVTPAEVTKWRIQTLKVGEMLPKDHHSHRVLRELEDLPRRVLHSEDCANAKNTLRALCKLAFNLALSMRRCVAEYEWGQAALPDSFGQEDVDRIESYNPREGLKGRAARILFGPLYKRVDGVLVLLRSGKVLYN